MAFLRSYRRLLVIGLGCVLALALLAWLRVALINSANRYLHATGVQIFEIAGLRFPCMSYADIGVVLIYYDGDTPKPARLCRRATWNAEWQWYAVADRIR